MAHIYITRDLSALPFYPSLSVSKRVFRWATDMVALLVSEALYTYTARLHGQVHEERTNGGGGGGAPVGRRRVGAFWGVDNSERVAIKGRIGKKAPLAKLRTCLSTLPRIHIHKWTARERGMGGERLKSRSFPLFPLSLSPPF